MNEQVVITGAGFISPLGQDLNGLTETLVKGQCCRGVTEIYPPGSFRTAATLPEIDFAPLLGQRGLKYHSVNTLMLTQACLLAFQDAGLAPHQVDDHLGLIVGSAMGNHGRITRYMRMITRDGPGTVQPMDAVDTTSNSSVDYTAIRINARGQAKMIATGACSSLDAIIEGAQKIALGQASMIMVAGCEKLYPEFVSTVAGRGCLGPKTAPLETLGRPYDQESQGMILGEGAAALLLEQGDAARFRQARVRARILGGASLFGPTKDQIRPERILARTIASALETAACQPSDIDWVCGSASGIPVQDRLELLALGRVFSRAQGGPAVSSIKPVWGDTFGAAGALAAVAAVGCMEASVVPATPGLKKPWPEGQGLDLVAGQTRKQKVSRALILCKDPAGFCSGLVLGNSS